MIPLSLINQSLTGQRFTSMTFLTTKTWEDIMKKLLTAAVAALGLALTAPAAVEAAGHEWKPAGPIKLIIAFRADGGADTQARLIAEELERGKAGRCIQSRCTAKAALTQLLP